MSGESLPGYDTKLESALIHNLIIEFKQLDSIMLKAYLRSGEILLTLIKKQSYNQIGSHIEKSDDVFRELGLKKSDAYNRMKAMQQFGHLIKKGTNTCPSRIVKLLPIVDNLDDSQKEEWLQKAELLSSRDFDDAILEANGKKASYDCLHEESIIICKKCKAKIS